MLEFTHESPTANARGRSHDRGCCLLVTAPLSPLPLEAPPDCRRAREYESRSCRRLKPTAGEITLASHQLWAQRLVAAGFGRPC